MNSAVQKPKIVFFGSGPVASQSLELLMEWCDIEAVITKPQPAHHRQPFPVIETAKRHNLPTHFVSKRKELDQLIGSLPFESRVGVLIDFGIIISQFTIDSFELGIVNSHFSLLPELRGADPITFSILSGQQETGISLMLLVEAMDEGPLLAQSTYEMSGSETTPQLTNVLIGLSDKTLRHILPLYITGDIQIVDQETILLDNNREATYSRKLTKDDSILDFAKPAAQLEREIRAFAEWPKSRTTLADKDVVITKAHVLPNNPNLQAAELDLTQPGTIAIQTSDGQLGVETLKPAGKGEMSAKAFLAGYKLIAT